jgi:hypothetical protein
MLGRTPDTAIWLPDSDVHEDEEPRPAATPDYAFIDIAPGALSRAVQDYNVDRTSSLPYSFAPPKRRSPVWKAMAVASLTVAIFGGGWLVGHIRPSSEAGATAATAVRIATRGEKGTRLDATTTPAPSATATAPRTAVPSLNTVPTIPAARPTTFAPRVQAPGAATSVAAATPALTPTPVASGTSTPSQPATATPSSAPVLIPIMKPTPPPAPPPASSAAQPPSPLAYVPSDL